MPCSPGFRLRLHPGYELVNAMGGDISSYRNVEDVDDVRPGKLTDPEYR